MQKTIMYLYPIVSKASSLKVFQDRTNQIKAFYFTKDNYKEIEAMESSKNYAIYFLFDKSEESSNKVYVGQSMNGIGRIAEHIRNKDFWSHCILFVTDNNSFDKLAIDYMEYAFIKRLKKTSYVLINKDLRTTEPNVSIYDKPNLDAYIEQIEFLLNAEGVVFNVLQSGESARKYYCPKTSKYQARLFVKDGQFVLAKGSIIQRPIESSKNWKSDQFYRRFNEIIDGYINDEKVEENEGKLTLLLDLPCSSPSFPGSLVTGHATNGWDFFKDLNELRLMEEEV